MPIIILSGDTSMENIRSLHHVGATYFISKPFNADHLIEQLRDLAAEAAQ
jgi:FixJ family two-component response regulator